MADLALKTRYDAVIVGGGHNGLVAAAYLARAGQSVLVLERNEQLGGASVSARVFPGLDARVSRYSYLVSLLPPRILTELGLTFTTRSRPIRDFTPYQRGGRPSALIRVRDDAARTQASVEELAGAADWRGLLRLAELEHALAARIWPSLLEPLRSRSEWKASLSTPDEREAWDWLVERPLGEFIEHHVSDDLLRGILLTDGKIGLATQAHDDSLLQNRCYLMHITGQGTGEWQVPVGGMSGFVDALHDAAVAAGATVMTRTVATAVQPGPAQEVVFEVAGEDRPRSVEAGRVLVNAGPQVLDQLLGRRHVGRPGDEGSVCKINMVLARLPRLKAGADPREAFAGTFRVNEAYSEMARSFAEAERLEAPARPPFELYCHTLTDNSILGPELRAAGCQTLTLFGLDAPYRLFERDEDRLRELFQERCLASLDEHLAEPVQECLAVDANGKPCIEVKTPLDLERELWLNRGNIFHGELSWFFAEDGGEGGWGVETGLPGIYRCGASAIRGGCVSGIPGRNAAQAVLRELSHSAAGAAGQN